jgi:hypothetical protein
LRLFRQQLFLLRGGSSRFTFSGWNFPGPLRLAPVLALLRFFFFFGSVVFVHFHAGHIHVRRRRDVHCFFLVTA